MAFDINNYTFHGSFSLVSGNMILGKINFVEDLQKKAKMYRISDLTKALNLPKMFAQRVKSRYRFPGQRFCWCDWISFSHALSSLRNPSVVIQDMLSRKTPEINLKEVKINKTNKIIDFLLQMETNQMLTAIENFPICVDGCKRWVEIFGGNPDDFNTADFESFSAIELCDLLKSYKFKIVKESESVKKEESQLPVEIEKSADGKSIQVTLNIRMS